MFIFMRRPTLVNIFVARREALVFAGYSQPNNVHIYGGRGGYSNRACIKTSIQTESLRDELIFINFGNREKRLL